MRNRVEVRYSGAFKRQVVEEVESGRFDSVSAASAHYGIKGATTVRNWVRRMGKGHLLAKVVRVEQAGEADQVSALRREVERLERALGQTQAERLLEAEYLKLACGRLGEGVEAFKKKSGGRPCTGRPKPAA
jgi:transposase-like protein